MSHDESFVKSEKERYVPFSVDPFKDPLEPKSASPPDWLALAGDLAWTASFSSLTSNTTVADPMSAWSYGVFFALTWHLWATQTAYDIQYSTNDWWHRILFACQLAIYAALAAFSGSFNVGWQLSSSAMNPFVGDTTELTGQAIREYEVNSMVKTFKAVNIILFVSRLLLFAQQIRVLFYPAFLFLGCFVQLQRGNGSRSKANTQIFVWVAAIAVQALVAIFIPDDDPSILKHSGTMAPRLSSLTVIIMGEGLNRICGTLRHSINSLGLTAPMIMQALSMMLVLYLTWLLYFDALRAEEEEPRRAEEEEPRRAEEEEPRRAEEEESRSSVEEKKKEVAWVWSHFPLHFVLIMMLEGIKNIFLYANVNEATDLLIQSFDEVVGFSTNLTAWPEQPRLATLLLPLRMSWEQEALDVGAVGANATSDRVVAMKAQLGRWSHTVLHNMYLLFNEQRDPEAEFRFESFLSSTTEFDK
ncbi:hypothetical protein FRC01_005469 [Tulasnella sp. 417]|nr:hypothetical protein FRC01_005469 [Tulasnella sp. 417]